MTRENFVVYIPEELDIAMIEYKMTKISRHLPKEEQAKRRKEKAELKKKIDELRMKYYGRA